jgi:hypothetical protein
VIGGRSALTSAPASIPGGMGLSVVSDDVDARHWEIVGCALVLREARISHHAATYKYRKMAKVAMDATTMMTA